MANIVTANAQQRFFVPSGTFCNIYSEFGYELYAGVMSPEVALTVENLQEPFDFHSALSFELLRTGSNEYFTFQASDFGLNDNYIFLIRSAVGRTYYNVFASQVNSYILGYKNPFFCCADPVTLTKSNNPPLVIPANAIDSKIVILVTSGAAGPTANTYQLPGKSEIQLSGLFNYLINGLFFDFSIINTNANSVTVESSNPLENALIGDTSVVAYGDSSGIPSTAYYRMYYENEMFITRRIS